MFARLQPTARVVSWMTNLFHATPLGVENVEPWLNWVSKGATSEGGGLHWSVFADAFVLPFVPTVSSKSGGGSLWMSLANDIHKFEDNLAVQHASAIASLVAAYRNGGLSISRADVPVAPPASPPPNASFIRAYQQSEDLNHLQKLRVVDMLRTIVELVRDQVQRSDQALRQSVQLVLSVLRTIAELAPLWRQHVQHLDPLAVEADVVLAGLLQRLSPFLLAEQLEHVAGCLGVTTKDLWGNRCALSDSAPANGPLIVEPVVFSAMRPLPHLFQFLADTLSAPSTTSGRSDQADSEFAAHRHHSSEKVVLVPCVDSTLDDDDTSVTGKRGYSSLINHCCSDHKGVCVSRADGCVAGKHCV